MRDKDESANEGTKDAPEVAVEFDGTGEHDADGEGEEGEVGCGGVVDGEEEAVGEDCEERRHALGE